MSMSLSAPEGERGISGYFTAMLGVGRDNAVSRRELCTRTGMSDRKMWEMIEQARHEGCLILNEQNGKGYYLPGSIEEVERQYRQMTRRALSILHSRKAFRTVLKEAGRDIR